MSLLITSAKNPLIKQLRHLATNAKARREAGEYIAEGTHLVASYLAAGGTPIRYIYAESARDNQEITDLIKHLDCFLHVLVISVGHSHWVMNHH